MFFRSNCNKILLKYLSRSFIQENSLSWNWVKQKVLYRDRSLSKLNSVSQIRNCSTNSTTKADTHNTDINMVKILNVAEKNDAAKSIAEVMARGHYRRREGFSKYNKIYEFEYNILNYQNAAMVMTSVSGHLLALEFVGQYKKWQGCSPQTLFEAKVEKYCPDNFANIKRTLEREVRGCNTLIIWTDCDREGENIGFEVIDVCQAVKPNIRVLRAKFSEITPQAIARACRMLAAPDKNTSDAVDVRTELDLRIGAAFTRFQTMRLQKVFPNVLSEQLISYGSCQFPTLGFVVERYKEVQAFIPEAFWKIKVSYQAEDANADFTWFRNRLFDNLACLVIYEHCLDSPEATVTDTRSKSKSKWRPQPLDTVELEKLSSRKLRINAKETMKIAEKLYTQGFISYPRTETNKFPKEFDLVGLIQHQTVDPNWGAFAAGVIQDGPNPRNGNKSDQAHPPIHPTKYTNSLTGNEKKVYDFIVRHFLATCSKDAQGHETVVDINVAGEKFSAQGLSIIARNYLDVYPYDKWNTKVIPVFTRGQKFQPSSIEMVNGETSPPSLLTEADLIALMDKHGIGTDATHAEHIETIKSRLYVGLQDDGKFVPGELGMGLVEGYDAMGYEMSKPNLRAELESDLKLICEGKKNKDIVLQQQIEKYRAVFVEACAQATKLDEALSEYFGDAQQITARDYEPDVPQIVMKCKECPADMSLRNKKDNTGYFVSCMGYPNCKQSIWFPNFVQEAKVSQNKCNLCGGNTHKIHFKFKRGSVPPMVPLEYEGCIGGCDQDLNEILELRSRPRNTETAPSDGNRTNLGNRIYNFPPPPPAPHIPRNNTGRGRGNSAARGNTTTRGNKRKPNPRPAPQPVTNDENDEPVMCNCNEPAATRTVRKEGPNTGREFHCCGSNTCQFFQWTDEPQRSAPNRPNQRNDSFNNNNTADDVYCECGESAKSLTVNKEGPNKGRPFYGCAKPMGQGCRFFQWGDEPPTNAGRGRGGGGSSFRGGWTRGKSTKRGGIGGRGKTNVPSSGSSFGTVSWPPPDGRFDGGPIGRGRGSKRSLSTSSRPAKKAKCSLCRETGHKRNKCPQNR